MPERQEVTTIIRTYNRCDKTISAIESALNQSLVGQSIIVVDDGSTDGVATKINDRFGSEINVIRHDENKGVGAAANSGLAAVRTPFVAFLDSDDVWEVDFLESMLSAFHDNPGTTLAYSDIRLEFPEHSLDYGISVQEPDAIKQRLHLPPFTMSSVVCRTRSARAVCGFSEDMKIGEDSDFYIKLWLRAPETFVHVSKGLLRHRIWSGNISNDMNSLIRELDGITRKYIRHPYFLMLRNSYAEVARQRLLGVAARHQVIKWLSTESSRALSLVVLGVNNTADLEKSLHSASRQRLPPIDVAVVIEGDARQATAWRNEVKDDWPFQINVLPVREGSFTGESVQYALNVLKGDTVLFLMSGEEFEDGALDLHRHAFSCSPQSVVMSVGGTQDGIPDAFPNSRKAMAAVMIRNADQISLSTISVARKALLNSNAMTKYRNSGFSLSLALGLLSNSGPVVRIAKSVVKKSSGVPLDEIALAEVLNELSETDLCHDLIGVFDEVLDA